MSAKNDCYHAKVIQPKAGQKKNVRVYKLHREPGLYCNYDNMGITYKASELEIGKVIPDEQLATKPTLD